MTAEEGKWREFPRCSVRVRGGDVVDGIEIARDNDGEEGGGVSFAPSADKCPSSPRICPLSLFVFPRATVHALVPAQHVTFDSALAQMIHIDQILS